MINGDVDLISVKNHITLRKLRAVVGLSSSLKAFALLAVYVYLVGRITVGYGITAARRPDTCTTVVTTQQQLHSSELASSQPVSADHR